MPQEQEAFRTAVYEILKVVIFENWLRFYFIVEAQDGSLHIELPEKSLRKISELYPEYLPLAQSLNNKSIDFETSRAAVLTYVLDCLDGKKLAPRMAQTVFSSSSFQVRMQMFNAWVQMHEDQLDRGFLDFGAWLGLFEQWESGPGAKELAAKLESAH